MASEKSPAFQFYPKDFMADPYVAAMTLAQRGAYITLLCAMWTEKRLPYDMKILSHLVKLPEHVWTRQIWPALAPCFTVTNDIIVQSRLERERSKQETWRAMKAVAGKKGGRAKADNKQKASRKLAEASPPSSSSSSSSDLNTIALPKPAPSVTEFLTWFQAEYKSRRDGAIYCVVWAKHGAIVKRLLRTHALERLKKHAVLLLSATVDEWIDDSDRGIEVLAAKINWLEERLASWEKQHDA